MTSARSNQLDLYAAEDVVDNNYRVRFDNTQALFKLSGAQNVNFDFPQYTYGSGGTAFNLVTRFAAIETDSTSGDNAAAIVALQTALASEVASRTSGDTTNANATSAEVSRATTAEGVNAASIVSEATSRSAGDAAVAATVTAEVSARTTSVAAEAARALAAENALSLQISSILSNADPAAIDSLSEVVASYQAGDTTLAVAAAAMLARIAALEATVNALVNAGL